jgi:uroporphyrinogen decarboxylase
MNSRERILAALRHEETDRVPIDFGGTVVTNISLPAYGRLKRHLDLTGGQARIFHTWSQVPEIETEISVRLHSDTVTLPRYRSSFGIPNTRFKPWTFVDETEYLVPVDFNPIRNEKGDFEWYENGIKLAEAPGSGSHGFMLRHNPLNQARTRQDIDRWFDSYDGNFTGRIFVSDDELTWARDFARRLRESTDKAIVSDYIFTVTNYAEGLVGWDTFYMHLLTEPDLIRHLLERIVYEEIAGLKRYLEAVGEYIDVILSADDLGHQRGPLMKLDLFQEFILPGHKAFCQAVHEHSDAAVLFHTDGTVIDFLPELIDAGVNCLNPVQTDAARMDPMELKQRFGNHITFWGGGADHHVLAAGTPAQVREDVRRRMKIFAPGGGYVFTSIHNILGDAPPDNILAAFDAAYEYGAYPIQAGPEDRGALAQRLAGTDYWTGPLEALQNES